MWTEKLRRCICPQHTLMAGHTDITSSHTHTAWTIPMQWISRKPYSKYQRHLFIFTGTVHINWDDCKCVSTAQQYYLIYNIQLINIQYTISICDYFGHIWFIFIFNHMPIVSFMFFLSTLFYFSCSCSKLDFSLQFFCSSTSMNSIWFLAELLSKWLRQHWRQVRHFV